MISQTTRNKVLHDLEEAGGPSGNYSGTIVELETPNGPALLWIDDTPHALPVVAFLRERCDEWHYAWSLVEDIHPGDYGFGPDTIWAAAARSDVRVHI